MGGLLPPIGLFFIKGQKVAVFLIGKVKENVSSSMYGESFEVIGDFGPGGHLRDEIILGNDDDIGLVDEIQHG